MKKLCKALTGTIVSACVVAPSAYAATFVGARNDFRDETIYFAMTTRFYDGDPSNNTYCWDGKLNVNDPEWRGDFKGLIEKLDYIKALGFTTVWITPVVENASGLDYHGYHAFNFSKVDPRYESEDCKFQDLITAAHNRGMKVVLDIVLQHTGNFGENYLCPMFEKDYSTNLSNVVKSMKLHPNSVLPEDYDLNSPKAFDLRIAAMKNEDGQNHDKHNSYHHVANEWNWDDPSRWWGQIAGDCVDLNTENPRVSNYLVNCYGKFIKMGVDGFRIDTSGHIARLTFNNAFIPQFEELAERYKSKRNGGPFFMFGEVCARERNVTYRNHEVCSPYFYTWKEEKDYRWDYSETSWDNVVVERGTRGDHVNATSVTAQGDDYLDDSGMPESNNALLNGNAYHTPDHSRYSGLSVIDFPMHWNFCSTSEAWGVRGGDKLYNDATYNVTYVDSHDYAPDGAPENQRFAGSQSTWASNLDLMFTFRGIPCIYYGSEIEFKKGCVIDNGANTALKNTGRAYFGGYIDGDVRVSDFADYTGATGNMAATLSHPLALHIQRLNRLRAAIPALRKGQYSTEGCSGHIAFKRRYTDSATDSYVLVTIGGNATFTGIENGTYTDAITGKTQTVTNGTLTASCSGEGNMRVYVLNTAKTKAPGKVGEDGKYLYDSSPAPDRQSEYVTETEPLDTETKRDNEVVGPVEPEEPEDPVEPFRYDDEYAVFFENSSNWNGNMMAWVWNGGTNYTGYSWPGQAATPLGNNIWKWSYNKAGEIPDEGTLLIFSGNGGQTGEMTWVNGGYYKADSKTPVRIIPTNGENRPDPVEPEEPVETMTYTFYFNNTANWPTVHVYIWDDGDGNREYAGKWPGTQMTETVSRAADCYKFTLANVSMKKPMVIFSNNGNNQTGDLNLEDQSTYDADGNKTTAIDTWTLTASPRISVAGHRLTVESDSETCITIATPDGCIMTRRVGAGVTVIDDLARGFYIVNGLKVVL